MRTSVFCCAELYTIVAVNTELATSRLTWTCLPELQGLQQTCPLCTSSKYERKYNAKYSLEDKKQFRFWHQQNLMGFMGVRESIAIWDDSVLAKVETLSLGSFPWLFSWLFPLITSKGKNRNEDLISPKSKLVWGLIFTWAIPMPNTWEWNSHTIELTEEH